MRNVGIFLGITLVMFGIVNANAVDVTIDNHSFENETGYPRYNTPTGWSMGGSTTAGRTGATASTDPGVTGGDGLHCGYLNAMSGTDTDVVSIYQNTSETFIQNQKYTLTVAIGLRNDGTINIPWKLSLFDADTGAEIASLLGTELIANKGQFADRQLVYYSDAIDAGKTIQIRITNMKTGDNQQLIVDNVRLSHEPATFPFPIAIANHSFEGESSYPWYNTPTYWSMGGSVAAGRTGATASTDPGVTGGDGTHCGYINNQAGADTNFVSLYQNTGKTFIENYKYTLTVALGLRSDGTLDIPWKLSLHDGDTGDEITSLRGLELVANKGQFADRQLVYYSDVTDIGKTIQVRVTNMHTGSAQQFIVDNVRLSYEPAIAPFPIAIANHSFEGELSYPRYNTPTDWSMGGSTTAGRTGATASSAPGVTGGDGLHCGYINAQYLPQGDTNVVSLYQDTGRMFIENYRYTLTVALGLRSDGTLDLPWKLSLHDSDTGDEIANLLGTELVANKGQFADRQLFYITDTADIGKKIQVRVTNMKTGTGQQLIVDNVRLVREKIIRGTILIIK